MQAERIQVVSFAIPYRLYKKLKLKCLESDEFMTSYVVRILEKELSDANARDGCQAPDYAGTVKART